VNIILKFLNRNSLTVAFVLLAVAGLLTACNFSTQSRYNYKEVGKIQVVNFGTVVAVRDIDIIANTSPLGAMAGGAAGAAAGSQIGSGTGSVVGAVGGAVGGILVGAALEQAIRNRGGVKYTVTLKNGKTLTVAQNIGAMADIVGKIAQDKDLHSALLK